MRSWLNMSIVLYALGAALFVWSGFMLLGGDTFATIDIAASLAGWGTFTIGLGAVTGALQKLTRAVVDGRQSRAVANAPAERGQRSDVVPVFVARGTEPAHFEPQPQPMADPGPVAEPDPSPTPQPFRALEPELRPAKPAVSVVRPPARSDDRDAAELSKKERRARRLQARQEAAEAEGGDGAVEAPVIAAPALGGRFMPRATVPAFDAPSSPAARDEDRAPGPVARTPQAAIIPVRPEPEPPADEPSAPAAAAPLDAEHDAPSAPLAAAATAPASEPEEASAPPAVSLPDPKVPEWLARARARREARSVMTPAQAAFAAAAATVAEPQPEPAPEETEPEPVSAEPEAGEPEPPQLEEAEPLAREPQAAEPEFAETPAAEAEAEAESESAEPEEAELPPAEFGASEPYAAAEPQLVREGEHKGVLYRFYDDGSVEAISSFGVRRFATVDELRDTVVAARGGDEFEPTEDAEAAVEEAPSAEPEPAPGGDALDAVLAELETAPPTAAPELRIDPSDRPGRR